MKNLIINIAAIVILGISISGCNAFTTSGNAQHMTETQITEATEPQSGIGKVAPEYALPDLEGNTLSSSSLKGKFVVIHFATTWCPFCNAEAPHLEQLHQDYKNKNLQVLIIDVQEPKKLVAQKLRDRFNLTFPILLDEDGDVATSFAPSDALPDLSRDEVMLASNLIIDPNGKIRYMSLLDSQNFDAKLIGLKKKLDEMLEENRTTGNLDLIELKNVYTSEVEAGKQNFVTLSFRVKDGLHIQANMVNDDSLIPAELTLENFEGIVLGKPVFPDWELFSMEGTDEQLWVFDNIVDVTIPVSVDPLHKTGDYKLKGIFYYQACDSSKCFSPRELEFVLEMRIV
jgi:peroxiredoxin